MSEPEAMQGQAGAGSSQFARNEPRPADGELRLIDLPVSGADQVGGMSSGLLTFIVALVVGIAGFMVGTAYDDERVGVVIGLLAGGVATLTCAIVLNFWQNHKWSVRSRAFRYRLPASVPLHLTFAGDVVLREDASRLALRPRPFLDLLRRCGCYGAVIRLLPEGSTAGPVAPIRVTFEPVMIDESDSTFVQIAGSELDRVSQSSQVATSDPVIRDGAMSTIGRRLRRARRLGSLRVLPWIVYILLFRQLALVVLAISLAYWIIRDPSPRSQIWAFPGGLLLPRWGKIYRSEQTLVVYNAQTSALGVALPDERPLIVRATPMEAEFALRALLSPVPSPSDEMLRSFMDGR